jgi:hypothetical protein
MVEPWPGEWTVDSKGITPGAEQAGPAISFAQDASGAVWFGHETPTKVVRWLDGQLTTYTEHDGIR